MKKCKGCKVLLLLLVLGGVIFVAGKLITSGKLDSKLYDGNHEDTTFKIRDTLRLLGDLCSWPINFIRALLPF